MPHVRVKYRCNYVKYGRVRKVQQKASSESVGTVLSFKLVKVKDRPKRIDIRGRKIIVATINFVAFAQRVVEEWSESSI